MPKFWKIKITTCAKILIIIIKLKFEVFWLLGLNSRLPFLEVKTVTVQTDLDRLKKATKSCLLILYKYYLLKISELKNQLLKLRFEIFKNILFFDMEFSKLINYSMDICWCCPCTTIYGTCPMPMFSWSILWCSQKHVSN